MKKINILLYLLIIFNLSLTFQIKNIKNINAATYNQLHSKDYAYISMITHCTDTQITSWNCKLCKNITMTDTAIISNATYSISGFIGYVKKYNQIVISWRGTIDAKNWEQDFKFQKTKYVPKSGTCDGCEVHTGVYESYMSVEGQIVKQVNALITKYPTATIMSTGHSLGGGLSLMTNLDLSQKYSTKMATTYNFGCLRIGNAQFANYMKLHLPTIFRVVHNKDPVPHVPPFDFSYQHPPYEVLYNQEMSNFTVCNESGQDKNCSNKFVPLLTPSDHTFYFVPTDSSVC